MAGNDVVINVKTKGAKQAKKGFSDLAKGAAAMGVAFAATKVVSFLSDSINAFSDLEESINAVTVQYGDQSDAVLALGENSAERFGITSRAVNDAAVQLSAFAEKIDEADPPAAFENFIQRATDFASVMNIETQDALNKFQSGLAGQTRPLQQFGIDVSAATVEQVALAEGIIQTGETMDASQKIQARYLTIMQQTEKTAGDFANTSDSLANSSKILSAKWKEAQVRLGKELAPAMVKIGNLMVNLIPLFKGLVTVVVDFVDVATPLISAVNAATEAINRYSGSSDDAGEASMGLVDRLQRVGDNVNTMAGPVANMIGLIGGMKREFWDAAEATAAYAAEQFVARRGQLELKEAIEEGRAAIEKMVPVAKEYTDEELAAMTEAAGKAKDNHNQLAGAMDGTRTALLRLTNPVFNANQAQKKYNEAVEAFHDDGGTQEEFNAIAEALLELEAAEAAVGTQNLEAMLTVGEKVEERLGLMEGAGRSFVEGMDAVGVGLLTSLEEFNSGLAEIADKRIQVEITATVPSNAEMDQLIADAIARGRRDGGGGSGGGFQS